MVAWQWLILALMAGVLIGAYGVMLVAVNAPYRGRE